jgi:shikimate kinase
VLKEQRKQNLVIATGGGIMTTSGNFELMQQLGEVVCLRASVETIVSRLGEDDTRPLLTTAGSQEEPKSVLLGKIRQLLQARAAIYSLPRHQIATEGLHPAEVAERIRLHLHLDQNHSQSI